MLKYSLGIDVSKASFHVCLSTIDQAQAVRVQRSGSFDNTQTGFKALMAWMHKEYKDKSVPLTTVMEATGVYYERLALFLHTQGLPVSVVLPNKAKKYIAALGIKTKNDAADAKALSCMGAQQALEGWEPMGGFFYTLRGLTRHYQQLQELSTVLANHEEATSHGAHPVSAVSQSNETLLAGVKAQLKVISKAISEHLRSDEQVAIKVSHLSGITGVGELTVAVVLGETGGFALFKSARQLIGYSGYDVVEDQSGAHVGATKISKRGNSRIRRCLHMPALCVVRWKVKVFTDLYERVLGRSGKKMKAYVAVQKKLLVIMYALWTKDQAFDEQYWDKKNGTKTEKGTEKGTGQNIASDAEAEFSSRHSGLGQAETQTGMHNAKKLAPRKGRAKQGIQPSDAVGVCILSALQS